VAGLVGAALLGPGSAPASPTIATAVVTGSYVGTVDGAPAAVAVIAEAPAADGLPRTISMYVCNGTSLAVWLTGRTTGNSAVLRSADGRFNAQVSLTPRRAGGVLAIPGGSQHRFTAPNAAPGFGLFDVTVGRDGAVQGRSTTGATLSGRIGTAGALPMQGTVAAIVNAGGTDLKLTALARQLTPGAHRWIVLAGGKVYGASKRGPLFGGLGGLVLRRLNGTRVVRIKAGGAGIKGWGNARCQGLANQWEKLVDSAGNDIAQGNDASADAKLTKAQGMLNTLTSNCFTTGIG
jgi:hypothetical protein